MKLCSRCEIEKPTSEFYTRQSGLPSSRCKECVKEASAQWREDHPKAYERNRAIAVQRSNRDAHRRRLRKYDLTHDEYIDLVAQQKGLCAICGNGLATDIDHDHETGSVRGLLCNNCNRGLGCFRDDPILLQSAIEYLDD